MQDMGLTKNFIPGILCVLTVWFISCENQNEEELFAKTDCDTIAPFSLEGYENVKIRVVTGQLHGALNHKDGYQSMPRGRPKLPDCDLFKIDSWIREGAQNN
jgi:hypothetical protein